MIIQHNMTAMNNERNLSGISNRLAKRSEKLSSGYSINRSADDAAGLSVSEKMRTQIRGLTQGVNNAQDGISCVQTAEGALNEVHGMLQRMNELAVQATNGTHSKEDREYLQQEVAQIKGEVDRVARSTTFNELNLLDGSCGPKGAGSSAQVQSNLNTYKVIYHFSTGKIDVLPASTGDTVIFEARDNSLAGSVGIANTPDPVANKIANEIIPNAVAQLMTAFPALNMNGGIDSYEIGLRIYSNSSSNTMAYAMAGYTSTPGDKPLSVTMAVNTAKFPDVSSLDTGKTAGELRTTIMHEMMHVVMQCNLPDYMANNRGKQLPMWFIEGTSQVAGGGFTANWNEWIRNPIVGMQFGVWDGEEIVRKWGLDDPKMGEYAQGYIATLYLGHLAGGGVQGGDPDASTIARGLNSIFERLGAGKSFDTALRETTGLGLSDIEGMFGPNAPNTAANNAAIRKMGTFVDNLGTAVGLDGAGSIVADGGLTAKPLAVVNANSFTTAPIYIGKVNLENNGGLIDLYDPVQNTPPAGFVHPNPGGTGGGTTAPGGGGGTTAGGGGTGTNTIGGRRIEGGISLMVGANGTQRIHFFIEAMNADSLGIQDVDIGTENGAMTAIDSINDAIQRVSSQRSQLGAVQNRLEHTINNLENVVENTTAAESRIRDADMAKEMVEYSNLKILQQAGQALLVQTKNYNQNILALLN
ncbi:MAG: flagellin [Lachnospiraceae bacterium]